MDEPRFRQIAARYEELDKEQHTLSTEQSSLLYNTEGNSHHPLAFCHLQDALTHRRLQQRISKIHNDKRKLASEAQHEGFPESRWIKVQGPQVPDDDATGIMLNEYDDGHCELIMQDWTLVLAEG